MRTTRTLAALAATPLLFCMSACGDDARGAVVLRVYGEAFIEEGIPAEATEDGWSVGFDRFEVTVEDVSVGGVSLSTPRSVELTAPSGGVGHEIGSFEVSAGSYTDSSFTLGRVELSGVATKDGLEKRFAWVIDGPTRYSGCETTTSVVEGGEGVFQITVHADHFLYDSLVAEEPALGFQSLADADLDGDGVIAQAELEATDIGRFDPGSEGGVDDLWSWLVALSGTLGHVDGEGHCDARPLTP